MYLDETILQSRTTITLMEFIDELMESRISKDDPNLDINIRYKEIKKQHERALKRRSRHYRTDLYDISETGEYISKEEE